MVIQQAQDLRRIVIDILSAVGASATNAAEVASHLVGSELSGVATHGVAQVPSYVQAIQVGDLLPRAEPAVLNDLPVAALTTGNWTFGHVAARHAAEIAIEKACAAGLAVVSIVQTHHIGRVGHYVEMGAREGMISMVFAGGFGVIDPQTVPYGGRTALMHTNPIAMGFPVADADPMMFDFATTTLSGVKVINAHSRGEDLPPGAIVDSEGRPTTDPQAFMDGGSHLPFGAHKGYALMMAVEFLGRVFSGSDDFADASRGGAVMRHQGVTMLMMKADLVRGMDHYMRGAADMVASVHSADPAPGFTEVLVPGDIESRSRSERERSGIPLHEDVWEGLVDAATAVGVVV